ncbi:uncharacterized protein BDW47DRAFT_97692 [Aspergillus candidus]|uniref:Uncharacterized protein n=1 Tax=Aspergillus candidus TaxID=41067 RepID=A0A2I2FPY8_ASPCN|nr:hypothetical protein BDW47DRAFT_97692 [Aspergillus candidus]PLB42697.1 hypothetical protein BDW47DRAFT_97692 [Aspergillus candidus]
MANSSYKSSCYIMEEYSPIYGMHALILVLGSGYVLRLSCPSRMPRYTMLGLEHMGQSSPSRDYIFCIRLLRYQILVD